MHAGYEWLIWEMGEEALGERKRWGKAWQVGTYLGDFTDSSNSRRGLADTAAMTLLPTDGLSTI